MSAVLILLLLLLVSCVGVHPALDALRRANCTLRQPLDARCVWQARQSRAAIALRLAEAWYYPARAADVRAANALTELLRAQQ